MDLYNKYFGIPQDKNFIKNAWYFPLLIKRNNINLCFTPIGSMNGNIYYSGRMYDYETAHFAYSTKEDILQSSREECKKIQSYKPEALMLIICCNRYAFMGEDEKQDLNYYSDCLEGMCYCHSFTEIAYKNNSGGVLNSALVSISLRESHDDIIKDKSFFTRPKNHNFKSSVIPVSFILSHFFNEMTKELISYQNNLEEEVKRIHDENSNLSLHIVKTLAATIDAKDRYTNGHSERVAEYSKKIAKRYGYNKKQLNEIYMIALLHDVGKIGVPDYIINKKSKLTDDEYQVIKEHSEIGAFILGNIKEMPKLVTGARWHHERYDGSGYPDGLYGNHIPEIARIIAVADAYDAMTSNRSYRKSLSQAYVRNEIEKGKNKQFDPVFADIMLQIIDEDIDYTLRDHAGINENRMLQMGMDQIAIPEKSDEAKHLSFSQLIDFGRSMPGGFFVYKAKDDEELLYVNDIVLDIYGCETINEFKSHTGFTFPGMVYEKDLDRIQNAITMQVKESTKQLDYVEYRIRRLDGEIRWVDDYGRLVNTIEFGDVYYVLIRDITDMHQERATLTDYDDLTKLFNRKHFDLIIHKKVIDILHLGGKLCLIMLDIDYFNNLVELYDTIYCNECICSISEIVKNSFHRKDDMVFRYGNDKFSVLLSNTDIDNALRIAERVRAGIRALGLLNESSPLKIVTVSGGIAVLDGEEAGFLANPSGELIRLAENALHEAKKNGRDMIKVQKSEFCKLTP